MKKERLKPNILTKQPIQGLLQESLQQKKNWIKVTLLDLWLWLSQKPKTWAFFDKERFIQEIYIVLKLWNLGFKISSLIPSAWCIGLISNLMTCDMSGVTQFCFISIINLRSSRISSVYITAIPNKIFWDQFTKFSKLQVLQKVKYLALFQFLSTISKFLCLQRILVTRLCLPSILKFSLKYRIS